jgi:hypothetical protein
MILPYSKTFCFSLFFIHAIFFSILQVLEFTLASYQCQAGLGKVVESVAAAMIDRRGKLRVTIRQFLFQKILSRLAFHCDIMVLLN